MMDGETTTTEVTEFEDGSKIIETKTVESEYIEGDSPPIAVEVAEPYVEPSVEIAQIEADRDVTIAAIEADARTAEVEALADVAAASEDESEWRRNIEAQLMTTQAQLAQVSETLLTLAQSTQPEPQPPTSNPASGEGDPPAAVVEVEVEAAPAAPEPPKRPKRSRWI